MRTPEVSARALRDCRSWRAGIALATVLSAPARAVRLGALSTTTLPYGPHPAELLDRIQDPSRRRPAAPVVFVHGGGWMAGTRSLFGGDLAFLARAGHTVLNIDYPLSPEHRYPIALLSVLRATSWLLRTDPLAEHGIVLMGDSAGGNLALMAALMLSNPALLERISPRAATEPHPPVTCVVSLYGVLDRLSWVESGFPAARSCLECYGGPAALEPEARLETAFTPADVDFETAPPTLLAVGTNDRLAPSSELGHRLLDERGVDVELIRYEGAIHGFLSFFWTGASRRLRRDVLDFLARHPAGEGPGSSPGGSRVLTGLALLCAVQVLGELLAQSFALPVPGNVLGMLLLFIALSLRVVRLSWLERAADGLLEHLGLLFVPAGVGVLVHVDLVRREWLPIVVPMIVSTFAVLAVTGRTAQWLEGRARRDVPRERTR